MSQWKRFKSKWKGCTLCPLHTTRKNIVLARGKIPCDFLFIGEAPGFIEDSLGSPFVGPAGKLLDKMIEDNIDPEVRIAFSNLICCIPVDASGRKVTDPPEDAIKACRDRLDEFISLCSPDVLVCVGNVAKKWIPKLDLSHSWLELHSIIHPAAILKSKKDQGLMIQRTENTLRMLGQVPF